MAREGATVIAADKNVSNAKETLNLILDANNKHFDLHLDVAEKASIQESAKKILEIFKKPPTIIVNCAGITRDNFLVKLSEEDFDEVIKVNLKVENMRSFNKCMELLFI